MPPKIPRKRPAEGSAKKESGKSARRRIEQSDLLPAEDQERLLGKMLEMKALLMMSINGKLGDWLKDLEPDLRTNYTRRIVDFQESFDGAFKESPLATGETFKDIKQKFVNVFFGNPGPVHVAPPADDGVPSFLREDTPMFPSRTNRTPAMTGRGAVLISTPSEERKRKEALRKTGVASPEQMRIAQEKLQCSEDRSVLSARYIRRQGSHAFFSLDQWLDTNTSKLSRPIHNFFEKYPAIAHFLNDHIADIKDIAQALKAEKQALWDEAVPSSMFGEPAPEEAETQGTQPLDSPEDSENEDDSAVPVMGKAPTFYGREAAQRVGERTMSVKSLPST